MCHHLIFSVGTLCPCNEQLCHPKHRQSFSRLWNEVPLVLYCCRGEDALLTKLQKFGRCGLAEYCNRECQRGDWKLHKVKCKRLTEIVVRQGRCDVRKLLRSGALRRRLLTLSTEGTVILSIRDKDITTIGDMNLAVDERIGFEAPFFACKSLLRVDLKGCTKLTLVGKWVVDQCTSLMSVVLPDSLTQLGEGAFNCISWFPCCCLTVSRFWASQRLVNAPS